MMANNGPGISLVVSAISSHRAASMGPDPTKSNDTKILFTLIHVNTWGMGSLFERVANQLERVNGLLCIE